MGYEAIDTTNNTRLEFATALKEQRQMKTGFTCEPYAQRLGEWMLQPCGTKEIENSGAALGQGVGFTYNRFTFTKLDILPPQNGSQNLRFYIDGIRIPPSKYTLYFDYGKDGNDTTQTQKSPTAAGSYVNFNFDVAQGAIIETDAFSSGQIP